MPAVLDRHTLGRCRLAQCVLSSRHADATHPTHTPTADWRANPTCRSTADSGAVIRGEIDQPAPVVQPSTPPKPHGELDRRTPQAARTFDALLRSGQTWHGVRLVEMDS
jgi:hypothetical protein